MVVDMSLCAIRKAVVRVSTLDRAVGLVKHLYGGRASAEVTKTMGSKYAYLLRLFDERLYRFDKLVLVPVILLLRLKVLDVLPVATRISYVRGGMERDKTELTCRSILMMGITRLFAVQMHLVKLLR